MQVPEGLRLVMCDVDCGSQTPGMVKKVLAWRKDNPVEADMLWGALQQGNEDLSKELKRLSAVEKNGGAQDYQTLSDIISTIRSLVREMSRKSGVPIEPKVQTDLLDACSALPGVVGGVCPGAGGFDAIALLVKNDEETIAQLHEVLDGWKSSTDADGGATIGKVRLLGVKQEMTGARTEPASKFEGWI